jgi:hypothetical protein
MKTALKDIMVREEKLASQNMVLEALAAGAQEEIKVICLASSPFTNERVSFQSLEGLNVKWTRTSQVSKIGSGLYTPRGASSCLLSACGSWSWTVRSFTMSR